MSGWWSEVSGGPNESKADMFLAAADGHSGRESQSATTEVAKSKKVSGCGKSWATAAEGTTERQIHISLFQCLILDSITASLCTDAFLFFNTLF
jgi:hypothetical protein